MFPDENGRHEDDIVSYCKRRLERGARAASALEEERELVQYLLRMCMYIPVHTYLHRPMSSLCRPLLVLLEPLVANVATI